MQWRDMMDETKNILEWLEDPRILGGGVDLRNTLEIVRNQPFRFTGATVSPEAFAQCIAYARARRDDFERFELSDDCLILRLAARVT